MHPACACFHCQGQLVGPSVPQHGRHSGRSRHVDPGTRWHQSVPGSLCHAPHLAVGPWVGAAQCRTPVWPCPSLAGVVGGHRRRHCAFAVGSGAAAVGGGRGYQKHAHGIHRDCCRDVRPRVQCGACVGSVIHAVPSLWCCGVVVLWCRGVCTLRLWYVLCCVGTCIVRRAVPHKGNSPRLSGCQALLQYWLRVWASCSSSTARDLHRCVWDATEPAVRTCMSYVCCGLLCAG